ncbi:MAG TPA: carbohydrate binding domain-containing protein, partial [Pirellulales bacterium]|nr:carbohydrate binding domain-containing protein [Pirellulales bacterium]
IQISKPGRENWHVQLGQAGLALKKDQPYTIRFRAKADAPRHLSVVASQAHEPWQGLWTSGVEVTTEWQSSQFTFVPSAAEEQGRVVFSGLGGQIGTIWLADVSLRPGGVFGFRPGEEAGHVEIFRKREFSTRTAESQRDWVRFLWQMEQEYWSGMAKFLKRDLKAHALLVGTQMGWSPYPIQAEFDVIDSHTYWHHPHFPGKQWDMNNWAVQNVPMADDATGGTLPQLGLSRVAGKPFICTEYNHAAPNTYAAETFPLIAAYAALQDWDGVFAFAYCHRGGDWDTRRISGFFDIDQHPTKMATLPAAVAMFVRGDVHSPAVSEMAAPSFAEMIDQLRRSGPSLTADKFGVDRRVALRQPVGVACEGLQRSGKHADDGQTEFVWHPTGHDGLVTINTPRSKGLIGKFDAGQSTALGDITILAGSTRQTWATLLLTAIDGADVQSRGRVLVTACGYAENTAMGWKNVEKTTVGADWGHAPSLVEGVAAEIALPVPADRLRAWALDERGHRQNELKIADRDGTSVLLIGPEHKTLWYEVEVKQAD